jgi:hypothetical protein
VRVARRAWTDYLSQLSETIYCTERIWVDEECWKHETWVSMGEH